MPISKTVKRVILFICAFLFLLVSNFDFYRLQEYLPADLLKELIISDSLWQIAFFILLGIYEYDYDRVEYTYNGKKIPMVIIVGVSFILFIITTNLRYLSQC